MLDFDDKPYRYFPPKRFWPTTCLIHLYNKYYHLPRTHRITGLHVTGHEPLRALHYRGDRVLFLPNHSTHSDAPIWIEALSRTGFTTLIMAAYDVFLRGRFDAWVMQRLGAFSVDRDGSDPKAMAEARHTLHRGRHALTIFPEGNVFLRNDRVTTFNEGAALLGLRSAKDMAKQATGVWAVPVSIKATYTTDVRATVAAQLNKLAKAVDADTGDNGSLLDRIRATGLAALRRNLKSRGMPTPGSANTNDLAELIHTAANAVLSTLEPKIGLSPRPKDSLNDRLKKARRAIHQIRLNPDRAADHRAAAGWADDAMLAFRIISYETDYVASNPTLDRFAETVAKLAEDIHAKPIPPFGPRHAIVRLGHPIDLNDYLERFATKARHATRALTDDAETAVQQGLDQIATENRYPGATIKI